MKREDLTKLGLTEDAVIDAIMAAHGKDIEKLKNAAQTSSSEVENLKTQLTDANKQIEDFKGMDIDTIKKTATDWEAKAKQAEADATAKLQALKYDHALDGALAGAKVKNPKAVKALLDSNALKFNDADGSIVGLDDQLKKVKESDAYLFSDDTPPPKIVAGGNNKSVVGDPMMNAVRKAAGLTIEQE